MKVIAIDIGGTKIASALVSFDEAGACAVDHVGKVPTCAMEGGPAVLARVIEQVRARLEDAAGEEIAGVAICDDDLDMLTGQARRLLDAGADLLIFSGGMSVDPDDLTPSAIRALGAEVVSHGVPSQPGNMTLVAYLGDVPVLGIPGASIVMPTTIFDVVLPQIFAGVKFTKEELIGLGDGGLCQLCKSCHFPNCTFGRY